MTFGRTDGRACVCGGRAARRGRRSRVRGATGAAVYDELNSAVQATPTRSHFWRVSAYPAHAARRHVDTPTYYTGLLRRTACRTKLRP